MANKKRKPDTSFIPKPGTDDWIKYRKYVMLGQAIDDMHHITGHFAHFHFLIAKIATVYILDDQYCDIMNEDDIDALAVLNEHFNKCRRIYENSFMEQLG